VALLQRKWISALLVLFLVLGYNGVSGWLASRGESLLPEAAAIEASDPEADSQPAAPSPEPAAEGHATETPPTEVWVHVCGEVAQPGLYRLPDGGRVNDAVLAAGGFTSKADTTSVNLAAAVADGQQLVIWQKGAGGAPAAGAVKPPAPSAAKGGGALPGTLPVSINQGSREALMLLDGIGEKTAQKIIDYREAQGGFKTLEELKNVPGIGDKRFDQIKNDIRL